jgi:hypothetical protein
MAFATSGVKLNWGWDPKRFRYAWPSVTRRWALVIAARTLEPPLKFLWIGLSAFGLSELIGEGQSGGKVCHELRAK